MKSKQPSFLVSISVLAEVHERVVVLNVTLNCLILRRASFDRYVLKFTHPSKYSMRVLGEPAVELRKTKIGKNPGYDLGFTSDLHINRHEFIRSCN